MQNKNLSALLIIGAFILGFVFFWIFNTVNNSSDSTNAPTSNTNDSAGSEDEQSQQNDTQPPSVSINKSLDLSDQGLDKLPAYVLSRFDLEELKFKADTNRLVLLEAKPLDRKKDIAGSKMIKALNYISEKLENEGFQVADYDWSWNGKAYFWYFVKDEELSEIRRHYGPPLKEEQHVREFAKKWKGHALKHDGNKIYIDLKRKYTALKDCIKEILKDEYLKENAKKIKLKLI